MGRVRVLFPGEPPRYCRPGQRRMALLATGYIDPREELGRMSLVPSRCLQGPQSADEKSYICLASLDWPGESSLRVDGIGQLGKRRQIGFHGCKLRVLCEVSIDVQQVVEE